MGLKDTVNTFLRPRRDDSPAGQTWIPSYQGTDPMSALAAVTRPEKVRTIFDIGAHTGDFARQFLDTFPEATVYCFEPSPRSFRALADRFAGNPRVKVYDTAVLERSGTTGFFCNRVSPTDSVLAPAAGSDRWVDGGDGSSLRCVEKVQVRSTSLDDFCRENGIPSIDVLKVDTQGAELRVIAGAKGLLGERRIRAILAELLFVPVYEGQPYFSDICACLGSSGYHLVNLFNLRFDEEDQLQIKWADGLFIFREWRHG